MIRSVVLLTALWVVLWRDPSWGTALGGVLAAATVVALVPSPRTDRRRHRLHFVALVRLVGFVAVQIVRANLSLARDVLRWWSTPQSGVVEVRLPGASDTVLAITGHLVTLTPGTLTVDADPATGTLLVHALEAGAPDEIRDEVERLGEAVRRALEPLHDRQGAPT